MNNQIAFRATVVVAAAVAVVGVYFVNKKIKERALTPCKVPVVAPQPPAEEPTPPVVDSVEVTPPPDLKEQVQAFNEVMDVLVKTIRFSQFNPEYHNGTGYFDPMCSLDLVRNEIIHTTDEKGRRVIVIGGGMGLQNVVIFERYYGGTRIVLQLTDNNKSLTAEDIKEIFSSTDMYTTATAIFKR